MADSSSQDEQQVSPESLPIVQLAQYPSPLCACASKDPEVWSRIIEDATPQLRNLLAAAAKPNGGSIIRTVATLSFGINDRSVLYAYSRRHTDTDVSAEGNMGVDDLEVECGIASGDTVIQA